MDNIIHGHPVDGFNTFALVSRGRRYIPPSRKVIIQIMLVRYENQNKYFLYQVFFFFFKNHVRHKNGLKTIKQSLPTPRGIDSQ